MNDAPQWVATSEDQVVQWRIVRRNSRALAASIDAEVLVLPAPALNYVEFIRTRSIHCP